MDERAGRGKEDSGGTGHGGEREERREKSVSERVNEV